MLLTDFIGICAGVFTTISLAPQAIKVLRTKKTKDLSLATYALLTTGIVLWFIYGILIAKWPIIIANGFCIPLVGIILFMKLREKK